MKHKALSIWFIISVVCAPVAIVPAYSVENCRGDTLAQTIKQCTQVIESKDNGRKQKFQALRSRGQAYQRSREFDKAHADFDTLIKQRPRAAGIYVHRARALLGLKRYNKALADINKALQLKPNSRPVTYRIKGRAHLAKKDYANALRAFNRFIQERPSAAGGYFLRGITYQKMRRKTDAIADYRKVIKIKPTHKGANRRLKRLKAN